MLTTTQCSPINKILNSDRYKNALIIRALEMNNAVETFQYDNSFAVLERHSRTYLFALDKENDFQELINQIGFIPKVFYVNSDDFSDEIHDICKEELQSTYLQFVLESEKYVPNKSLINNEIEVVTIDTSWTKFILSMYKSEEFGYKEYIDYCIENFPCFGALYKGKKVGYVLVHKDGEIGSMVISPEVRGKKIGKTLMQHITPEYAKLASIGCGFVLPENFNSQKMMFSACFELAEKKALWVYT